MSNQYLKCPINIKFCPKCSQKVKSKTSNFCDKCGICLRKKTCNVCVEYGFWEYCVFCGKQMTIHTENITLSTNLNSSHISNTSNIQPSQDSQDSDSDTRIHKKRSSSKNKQEQFKMRVNITSGDDKKTIPQNNGGGTRTIDAHKSDNYKKVFQRIIQMYFPADSSACIGSKDDFKLALLDFKKEKINENQFNNLENYMQMNGLDFKKLLFNLHLTKQLIIKSPPMTSTSIVKKDSQTKTPPKSKINVSSSETSSSESEIVTLKNPKLNTNSNTNTLKRKGTVISKKKKTDSDSESESKIKTLKNPKLNTNSNTNTLKRKGTVISKKKETDSDTSTTSTSSDSSYQEQKKLVKKTNSVISSRLKIVKTEPSEVNLTTKSLTNQIIKTPIKTKVDNNNNNVVSKPTVESTIARSINSAPIIKLPSTTSAHSNSYNNNISNYYRNNSNKNFSNNVPYLLYSKYENQNSYNNKPYYHTNNTNWQSHETYLRNNNNYGKNNNGHSGTGILYEDYHENNDEML